MVAYKLGSHLPLSRVHDGDLSLSFLHHQVHEICITLFLFTWSDFKTILLPVTVFALTASQSFSIGRLPLIIFWTWLHLLQFCVSNQSKSPEEDAANKPWRPIPAGRISVAHAQELRWALLPICLLFSAYLGVLVPSIMLALTFLAHDEWGTHVTWLPRNLSNVFGYTGFEWGATCVASAACSCGLDQRLFGAFAFNALIIFTTIDAQDYRDEEGDRLCGRRTLPILLPKASRPLTAAALCGWSVILSVYWHLPAIPTAALIVLGAAVASRFCCLRTPEADRRSYLYYNIWLCAALILPFSCS